MGLCWIGDDLAAVVPFTTRRHRGVRVLEWAAKDCSDYCDALVDPALAENSRALKEVWAAVVANEGFDLAYLSHVRPDAAFHQLLDQRSQAVQLRPSRRSAVSRQVHDNGRDGNAWFQRLDEAARDSHARGMHILKGMGPVRSEMCGPTDGIQGVIERMIGLKRQWLANTGQSYEILDNNALTLRALIKELIRQQALRIFSLYCGDRLVAALLTIAAGARMQVFFAAHDPHFDRAAPETLALIEFIIKAIEMGTTEIDLLCVEDETRFTFAKSRVELASYVGARTLLGKLALAVGS